MVWSLKKLFGREQVAPAGATAAPEQSRAATDAADYQEIKQKSDRLAAALREAGTDCTTRFIAAEPAVAGDYPVIARDMVCFTDPRGTNHAVQIYADRSGKPDGADVSHAISYDREITFELAPVSESFIRENPALAADALGRIGIHENIREKIPEDQAPEKLLAIAKELPGALPVTLKLTVHDSVTQAAHRAEMILPSDAAHYLEGGYDPEITTTQWDLFKDSVVFSAKPEERIRDHEGLCPSNPIDGFAFTAPHALNLDYIGNKVEIRIPRAAFGDTPAAQLVSRVESTDWKKLDDVIAQVRGFNGPDNNHQPRASL